MGDDRDSEALQARIGRLAWLLDNSIALPGGFRIGIESLIGLIPGIGDVAGSALSSYIVYEAARAGAPKALIARMVVNVLAELAVGVIPIVGDVFDFAFKANMRNAALLDRFLRDRAASRRSSRLFGMVLLGALATLIAVCAAITFVVAGYLWNALSA